MPVNDEVVKSFTQLGIAGAALVILLVFVVLLFYFMGKQNDSKNKSEEKPIDRLCNKIDALITSNADYTQKLNEVLITNDKDQKETIKLYTTLLDVSLDTQKRVVRIDDRTYQCLGNPIQKEFKNGEV